MDEAQRGAGLSAFADAVSLWRLTPGAAANEVIDAATQLLVHGVDSPTLRELAGASSKESWYVLQPMIENTLHELGMGQLLTAGAERAALEAMLRRFKAGRLTARELVNWAHSHIGHYGDPAGRAFVELDDMYDDSAYQGVATDELDQWTVEEADAFLNGQPSPGRTAVWHTQDATSDIKRGTRLGERLRRLVGRS